MRNSLLVPNKNAMSPDPLGRLWEPSQLSPLTAPTYFIKIRVDVFKNEPEVNIASRPSPIMVRHASSVQSQIWSSSGKWVSTNTHSNVLSPIRFKSLLQLDT